MTFELIKYVYGLGPRRYTAFCLTPRLETPQVRKINGKEVRFTNRGPNSMQAKHFQTPEAAQAWLRSTKAKLLNPDWSLLQGTAILSPDGKAK